MKTRELARARIGRITPPAFEHINRQIPPEPHTAMYVWHKYWSRKTWNVVGEHIQARLGRHRCNPDRLAPRGFQSAFEQILLKPLLFRANLFALNLDLPGARRKRNGQNRQQNRAPPAKQLDRQ